ncbi:MAG TPA: hypothetical protein VGM88_26810 [Kofleriaceae bacterium]|jgi:hypothetical protein
MKLAGIVLLACACGGGAAERPTDPVTDEPHAQLAPEDAYQPTYGKADLQKALFAERGAEATNEKVVAELEGRDAPDTDALIVARADLGVRRRFIASLVTCQQGGIDCPPRIDDPPFAYGPDPASGAPPLTVALRFDRAGWQLVAQELYGRACACRTMACVDGVSAAIEHLEPLPHADVQGDEEASLSITRARECLYRLRGRDARAKLPVE